MKWSFTLLVLALLASISTGRVMADEEHQPSLTTKSQQLLQVEHVEGIAEKSSELIATVYWGNGLSYFSPVFKVGPYSTVLLAPLSSESGTVELTESCNFQTIEVSLVSNDLFTQRYYFQKYIDTKCLNPRDVYHRTMNCTLMVVTH